MIKVIKNYNNIKQNRNYSEKDIIIERQQKELISLTKEILNLTNEIKELKSIISLKKNTENEIEEAKLYIEELKKKNEDLSIENKEKEVQFNQQLNNLISEKENQKIKYEKDNIIYKQKMSIINYIEMENDIYKNEVNNLKEKQKEIENLTNEKIKKMEYENIIKYNNLKKQMMKCLIESKENISKLKLEYLDINGKLSSLQNYQLLSELECLSKQNKELINENNNLKKQIYELEKDLDIHKKVETKLASKIKNIRNLKHNIKDKSSTNNHSYIKENNISYSTVYSPRNIGNLENNINIQNNSINYKITKKLRKIMLENSSNKLNNIDYPKNKNSNSFYNINPNTNTKDSDVNYNNNNSFIFKGSYSTNYFFPSMSRKNKSESVQEKKYNYFNRYTYNKNEDNEKLKLINENLKQKMYTYESQYKGLFSFLEQSLEKFFKDVEKKIKEKGEDKTVYIDIEKIKRFDFSIFNDIEKYNLLILIMNYLLPLVTVNFKSNCNIKKNLFCTNLNLIDRKFNKNSSYLKDKFLRKAFLDKNHKLKADLYIDKNNNFSNSIPVLRRNKSIYENWDNKLFASYNL